MIKAGSNLTTILIIVMSLFACEWPVLPTQVGSSATAIPPTVFEPINVRPTLGIMLAYPQPCIDSAIFKENVTIPPDTELASNQVFEKIWRIENNGTCVWKTNYSFKPTNTVTLQATSIVLPQSILPNEAIEIIVQMVAPSQPGDYCSEWQLFNDQNKPFGQTFVVLLKVK